MTPHGDIGCIALWTVALLVGCLEVVDVVQPRLVGGAVLDADAVEVEIAEHLGNNVFHLGLAYG